MTIPSVTYPLDLTGTNENNLVRNEVHQIAVKKVRAIATVYGPFYAASMQVVDNKTGRLLTSGRDFYTTELYVIPTNQSGKDVCSIVIVTDTTASDTLSLTYQVLGGKYSDSDQSLADLLNSINFNARSTAWPSPIIKAADVPLSYRLFGKGTRYGFEYAVEALERIEQALRQGDQIGRDALYTYLEAHIGHVTPDLVQRTQYALTSAFAKHRKAANPHPQYFLRSDKIVYPAVRKPVNKAPINAATNVTQYATLTGDAYAGFYHVPQIAAQFQVALDAAMTNVVIDQVVNGAVVSWQPFDLLDASVRYYWRVRYQSKEGNWSLWSDPTYFTTVSGAIKQPSITAPTNGATNQPVTPTLTSSAFAVSSGADTPASTDWEIWTGANGTGTRVFASLIDKVNLTSIPIQPDTLVAGTTYYPRVRHRGNNYTSSAWSNAVSFSTASAGIVTPSITAPVDAATNQILTPTLTASAFATSNATDTHASTDWEVWTGVAGTGTLVWSSYADTASKTTIGIPTGKLAYGTTYHPRVRYRGNSIGVSGWSNEVSFTTKIAPPAAGTVLGSRCQGFDLYNSIADGNGGNTWVLAQTNSTQCNYTSPAIPAPSWTSADGRSLTDRLGSISEYITVFAVTGSGSDSYARTEWEVYNSANTLVAFGSSTTQSVAPNVAASKLVNHAAYKMRSRFVGVNLGASPWSTYINFSTNWPDSPAAGTVLRTFCTGYDKYEERSDGNYGSYNVLIETNASYCGYVTPYVVKPTITSPASGNTFGDWYSVNAINFNNTAFQMGGTNPNDAWAATEYQLLNSSATAVVKEFSIQAASYLNSTFANLVLDSNSGVVDNTWYLVRMRHRATSGKVSAWADAISVYVDFTDAGTYLRAACVGYDKYAIRANGHGGEYQAELIQANSTDCGYVAPQPPASTFTSSDLNNLILNSSSTGASAEAKLYLNTDGTWSTSWMGTSHYQSKPDGRWLDAGQNPANFSIHLTDVQLPMSNGYRTILGNAESDWFNMTNGWWAEIWDSSGTGNNGSTYQFTANIRNNLTGEISQAAITLHAAGGCFAVGTILRTPTGDVLVEDLKAGDVVSSFDVPSMVDESVEGWRDWKTDHIDGFDPTTTAVVRSVSQFTQPSAMVINGIKSTLDHVYFVFDGMNYCWKQAQDIRITDQFIDDKGNLVPITSLQLLNEMTTFVLVDVETLDTLQVKCGDIYLMSHNATYAT